jgi:hypothetical protein
LAKVNNTDIRAQYFDNPDGAYTWDFWLADGAFMATDKLKIKYELHYWKTDITGSSESDFESLHLKPIYFPKSGTLGGWKYGVALGVEWIKDFRKHFVSYKGDDINMTATRLIAIKSLPERVWMKYDLVVPIDWEHDNAVPATVEVQLGKMYNKNFGLHAQVGAGLGSDRPYDWGVGVGARFMY